MRIGIDFDDTLADWGVMLTEQARARWNLDLVDLHATGGTPQERVGEEAWRRLILDLLETDLGLEIPAKPGAAEVTRALAERHEMVVLTARHDYEAVFVEPWLRSHDIPIREVVATSRASKDSYAHDLGLRVHLDDTARVFDTFVDHPCASVLLTGSIFDRHEEPAPHVRSVESWHRFAELVRELDDPRPHPGAER